MGWRYRKSFSILPGLRLNMGKSGLTSLSVGGRGATLNLGKKGVMGTVSLPGTGLSYQHRFKNPPPGQKTPATLLGAVPPSGRTFPVGACVIGAAVVCGYLALRSPTSPSPPSVPAPIVQAVVPATSAAPDGQQTLVPQAAARGQDFSFQTRQVTTIQANVRAAPSMSGPVLRTLLKGQVVQALQTENGWTRVAEQDRVAIGWMHNSVLK
jgi:Protein of unknown function (DUF4236)/Bacterial SH3 domain